MATVVKNFKIKQGLVVEGNTGTIAGFDILTKKEADQSYITSLVGGSGTSANTPETLVKRDESGNFAAGTVTANLVGNVTGNADTASTLATSRTIELTGDVTGSVLFDGSQNVQISTTLDGDFATDLEVATAKGEAIDAAALDATTKANNAEAAANLYTDGEISDLDASLKLYADAAETDAKAYTDTRETAITTAYQAYADQAETDAKAYTDVRETAITSAYQAYADQAETDAIAAANAYTDQEVAALVDGAPALLDTLNELAAAIADNPNYATDVANLVASKADTSYVDQEIADAIAATTYTAGTNIDITGNVVSVTGLASTDISDFNTAALSATASAYDVAGSASTAQANAEDYADGVALTAENNAKSYADGLAVNYEVAGAVSDHDNSTSGVHGVTGSVVGTSDAQTLTNKTINGNSNTITNIDNMSLVNSDITINGYTTNLGSSVTLDTDDISEGASNKYYSTTQAKSDAASLLTSATLSNITITGDGSGLTITAENGVAQSTTDDLAEGEDNLYYTDQRVTTHIQNNLDTDELSEGVLNKYFTDDRAKDAAGAALTGGTHTNVSVSYDNVSKTISLTGAVTYTDEDALDAVGEALTAGSNIAITPDDGADTITVALVDDVVIPTTGSLEVESNDFNVGADSVGLRASDGYTNAMAVFSMDADDDYAQLVVKNTGTGVNSSSDVIAYANNGDDASGWIDLGITSATFSDPDFTITGANDGYIFMEAPAGTTGDGNLVLATGANGTTNAIVFAAGGLSSDNTQMTITPDESVRIVIPTASTSPTTGALVVDGGVGIQGDVNIQGTITFGGSGTTVTTDNLAVQEPVIYLADGNTTDNLDIGIVAQYDNDGAKYAGIVRDATDGAFKLFTNATTKPVSTVNFAEAGLEYGDLKVDALEATSATLTNITIGVVNQDEIAHLNGVTANIQDQLDDKLALAGGTLTGSLTLAADPTTNLQAATKQYVDGEISTVGTTIGNLTTDDIAEGSNLYFTDQKAVDALEAVVPNFTEVDINSVVTQMAVTGTATGGTVNTVYSFATADYRSAKFIVKVAHATHTEVSEVLLTLDSNDNVAITEYAVVGTNGSLSAISAEVSGGNVNLTVEPANTSTVKVFGTLIA